jgi:hypothetical protein
MELPTIVRLFVLAGAIFQAQPGGPIIVKITEPPKSELSTLSEVLLGSLGLSGLLALMAILLGIAVGALMFWFRKRSA